MSTFALIHGGGGGGWEFHLLEAELRAMGHRTVAPDLPADDESATLSDFADTVIAAIDESGDPDDPDDPDDVVVVAHSFGGFTGPLVAERRAVAGLVLVSAMVPSPGETGEDWWTASGWGDAERDASYDDDTMAQYYHDVPELLAREAIARERAHPSWTAYIQSWPLARWPAVPTRFVLGTQDRLFPPDFMKRLVKDRLGVTADELPTGHCPHLAQPRQLAELLTSYRFDGE
jgi:pimeloyl-ACP methyl ester carboxylesterase